MISSGMVEVQLMLEQLLESGFQVLLAIGIQKLGLETINDSISKSTGTLANAKAVSFVMLVPSYYMRSAKVGGWNLTILQITRLSMMVCRS